MEVEKHGGFNEIYTWNQSTTHITLTIKLPEGTRGRDVAVSIEPTRLSISIKGNKVVDGEFFARVRKEDCIWSISDGEFELILHKFLTREWSSDLSADKTWWQSVVKGEALNPNKTPPTSYYFTKDKDF